MAKTATKFETGPVLTRDSDALAAALAAMAAQAATDDVKGRAAIDGLLAMGDALFERYSGQDTEQLQRLAAVANGHLKSGRDKQFPTVKAFLIYAARMPLNTDGQPNKAEYDRIRQAWMHDVRQGAKFNAGGKKGKRGGKRPYGLNKATQAIATILKRLKSDADLSTVYRQFIIGYCERMKLEVPAEFREKSAA